MLRWKYRSRVKDIRKSRLEFGPWHRSVGLRRIRLLPKNNETFQDAAHRLVLVQDEFGAFTVREQRRCGVDVSTGYGFGIPSLAHDVHGPAYSDGYREALVGRYAIRNARHERVETLRDT